jgi:hypothetical protein
MRIAAVGDLHCTRDSAGALRPLFAEASEAAEGTFLSRHQYAGDVEDSPFIDAREA